jgi:hypothetical protein
MGPSIMSVFTGFGAVAAGLFLLTKGAHSIVTGIQKWLGLQK